jgi:inhibitor of cysteine peptidase
MKLFLKWVVLIFLTCASVVFAKEQSIPMYAQDKTSIAVTPSQAKFILKLTSNPTTGYSWFLREYDSRLLEPIEHHFISQDQKNGQKLMGAPGVELWTFRMTPLAFMVPRQTVVKMVYARSWEKNQAEPVVFTVSSSR